MGFKLSKASFSWALYDWANSAFATTVIAGFFPVFYKTFLHDSSTNHLSTTHLGFTTSLAAFVIMILAPFVGAFVDCRGIRKKALFIFTLLGVLATACFSFLGSGDWFAGSMFYGIALVGFYFGILIYDSLLVSVASHDKRHFLSALGYSLGYLGGGILFGLNVLWVLFPDRWGFEGRTQVMQWSFLSVAMWWLVFSLPLFFFLKESPKSKDGNIVGELKLTFKLIFQKKEVFYFLLAYWFYIDGVHTVIHMAVNYGLSIGLESQHLITAILITQLVGFPATFIWGLLAQKLSSEKVIIFSISAYLIIVGFAFQMTSEREFYVLAALVGVFQGAIQALSRSYFSGFVTEEKTSEYFGIYNMVGKFAAIMGPALMAVVTWSLQSQGMQTVDANRFSLFAICLLLFLGLFFFRRHQKINRAS